MNKSKANLSYWIFILLFFICCTASAQIKTSSTNATPGKAVTISISGIEYDDPGYAALRNNLKTIEKAKDIKQSFQEGTAKISLAYNGSATDLWDELPAT